MKKLLIISMLCIMCGTFANEILPIITGPLNFPSSFPGIIFSNATRAMYRERKADLSQYQVLGKVETSADMSNVLLIINWGDTSLANLKAKALAKYPDADDIVNIELDCNSFNIVVFYINQTVTLRGVAVKYKK